MKLLLDTHVFLWMHAAPRRLSARARKLLADRRSELVVSVVVPWEIAIKAQAGKLRLPEAPFDYVVARAARDGMQLLAIDAPHVAEVARLPLHHSDPFDRMLVAQARVTGASLMTADAALACYDVAILDAA